MSERDALAVYILLLSCLIVIDLALRVRKVRDWLNALPERIDQILAGSERDG